MDLVLRGSPIRPMDPAPQTTQLTLTIRGDRIEAGAPAGAQVLDLGGRCVLPGFSDAHVHFPTWAIGRRQVRLEDVESLEEALERVTTAPGGDGWLRGLGWRDASWSEPPTRWALDRVTGDRPTGLMSRDYHSLWLNSAALALADELEAPGGVVERDERGEPTGIVRETAAWQFRDRHLLPTLDELTEASEEGLRVANARGVTAIHDKDGWLGSFVVFQRLRKRGRLTLRVWQSLPADRLPHLAALGLRSGFGDDLLRLGYLKVFMDGTLGSATARLLDGSGVWITERAQLEQIVRDGAAAGFPVAVHAIGDAANRAALDAFEATRADWEPRGLLPRIEHAQLLHADDVPRFAQLGVAASVQFSHAPSDRDLADRVWEGHEGAYAYRTLLDAGTLLANGSDAPIEELDPLQGIRAGALRTLDERPSWRPRQCLSVAETLLASTVAPARLARDDDRRGTLTPGKLADLVVLDRDPLACSEAELAQIQVVATMLGGRWVHGEPPWPNG